MTQLKPVDQKPSTWQCTTLLATDNSHSIIGEIVDGKHNSIAYTAYGEQSSQQEDRTRLSFNGQLREAKIGWYLLGNGYRAYNPRLMRFHSPDSWSPFGGGGVNAYMYCAGDPINRADPTGHFGGLKSLYINIKKGGFGMGTSRPVPLENLDLSGALNMLDTAHRQRINAVTPSSPSFLGLLGAHFDSLPQWRPRPTTASVPELSGHGVGGKWPIIMAAPQTRARRSSIGNPNLKVGGTRGGTNKHPSVGKPKSMPLSSADTFAATQQPKTVMTYPVGVGNPPPHQVNVQLGSTSSSSVLPPSSARVGGSTHSSAVRPTAAVAAVRNVVPEAIRRDDAAEALLMLSQQNRR